MNRSDWNDAVIAAHAAVKAADAGKKSELYKLDCWRVLEEPGS